MSWTKPCLVELDAGTITAMDVGIDDLEESFEYLKWAMDKQAKDSLEKHACFFEALIDELDGVINLLKCIRPPTEKYSLRPRKPTSVRDPS